MLTDAAISGDRNVIKKDGEEILKCVYTIIQYKNNTNEM
jgi:hypothetical protein